MPGDPGEWGVLRAGTPPPPLKLLTKDTVISARMTAGFHAQGPLPSPSPDKTHPGTMSWSLGEHCWDQGCSLRKEGASRGLETMKATSFT